MSAPGVGVQPAAASTASPAAPTTSPRADDGSAPDDVADTILGSDSSGPQKEKSLAGWFKSKAATLEGHMTQMRENTKQMAQDIADLQKGGGVSKERFVEERFDATFFQRGLGLELDLRQCCVRNVKPGGQAETLNVAVHDRLVAIDGNALPAPPPRDVSVEESDPFIELVKGRMSQMSRPVTLTFSRLVASTEPEPAPTPAVIGGGDDELLDQVKQFIPKLPVASLGGFTASVSSRRTAGTTVSGEDDGGHASELEELATNRELVQRFEAELIKTQAQLTQAREEARVANADAIGALEEASQLRADVADVQLSKVWGAQEVRRCQAELDQAQQEAQRSRAEQARAETLLEASRERVRLLEAEFADLQQVFNEHRAEHGMLQSRVLEAEAHATDSRRERGELAEQLVTARAQLGDAQASCAEQIGICRADTAEAKDRLAEVERLRADCADRAWRLQESEAELSKQLTDAATELAALTAQVQRQDVAAKGAERTIEDLRNELARALRSESKADGVGDGPHSETQADQLLARIQELTLELDRCRNAGAPSLQEQEAIGNGLGPSPVVLGARDAETSDTAVDDGSVSTMQVSELRARVLELEEQIANLNRQLQARPIVFQYSGGDDLDDEDVMEQVEAASAAAAAAAARRALGGFGRDREGAASGGSLPDDFSGSEGRDAGGSPLLVAYAAFLRCRQHGSHGFRACRRQRVAQTVEKSLRLFTRSLLQRPLLLWLFYAHVLILWMMEGWRQAASQSISTTDPARQVDRLFHAASNLGPP